LFAHGMLMVPTSQSLLFVDPATGIARVSWNPGKGVTATPIVLENRLYVLSNLGYLYALRLSGRSG
jgi:outer membrane protein assembly factor BamB